MQSPESVAAILFNSDRTEVLLIQRRDVPVWVLPGGGLEANEKPEVGIIREALEETGFKVEIKRLVGVYTPINRLAKVTYLYECSILEGSAITTIETRGIQFFNLKALPKLIPPPYPDWIADSVNNGATVYKPISSATYLALLKNLFLHPILILRFILARMGWAINTNKWCN